MSTIKLVTFDVTGTLLFFRIPILEKYAELGSKFGVKINSLVLKENFKKAWITLNEAHPNFGKKTDLNWYNWWELFVKKTFSGSIRPEEKYKISLIAKELIDYHTTKEAFNVRPGTDDLLTYLKTKPLQLGIISNYDPRLNEILEFMNLKQYFNFVLISYEFGHAKPDARIFKEALKLGKCSSGLNAVHVGDDITTDYLGAKNAGLKSILITSDEEHLKNSQVQENEVFKDFYELKMYFQKLELN